MALIMRNEIQSRALIWNLIGYVTFWPCISRCISLCYWDEHTYYIYKSALMRQTHELPTRLTAWRIDACYKLHLLVVISHHSPIPIGSTSTRFIIQLPTDTNSSAINSNRHNIVSFVSSCADAFAGKNLPQSRIPFFLWFLVTTICTVRVPGKFVRSFDRTNLSSVDRFHFFVKEWGIWVRVGNQ